MKYNSTTIGETSKKAFPLHFFLRSLTRMHWFLLALLFTGCLSRSPLFNVQRDENPFDVPNGSVGVIPPVLQTVQVLEAGSVYATSENFSLFGGLSPVSQNFLNGNEFRMTTSTLAIGAQNLKGHQPKE